jgi:hypothetical protein
MASIWLMLGVDEALVPRYRIRSGVDVIPTSRVETDKVVPAARTKDFCREVELRDLRLVD